MDNGKKFREIINPHKKSCSICREINRIYNNNSGEAIYSLPEDVGKGYLKRLAIDEETEISLYDFIFREGITMEETALDESFRLSFCLAEAFEWYSEGNKRPFYMRKNESCIFSSGFMHSTGIYNANLKYHGLAISLHPDKYKSILKCFNSANAITDMKRNSNIFRTYKITRYVKEIIQQIISCSYSGILKSMFFEGKVLELIAVYINEVISEKDKGTGTVRLTSQDLRGLHLVKELLDNNFVEPMTISNLAKCAYVNEYKLKVGFKEIYGQSVYSYVIDKRMDAAKQLFEQKDMKIKDVASRVGYTNISHFIEAFRKKFGITPGVYLRNLQ